MSLGQKLILYATLGLLCLSLLLPGLWEVFRSSPGHPHLLAQHVDALNQLRAYNGMVAAVGLLSGIAIFNIESNRTLILTLAFILIFLTISRLISVLIDGMPGLWTLIYIVIESLIALILFVFRPPKGA